MIEVVDLVKDYRAGDGSVVHAVEGISFTVAAGETVGLLGANGAGKTTTLRVLATLLKPTSGTARVAGHDVVADPVGVRRHLGYVSATTGVPDRLTPREIFTSFGAAARPRPGGGRRPGGRSPRWARPCLVC
jgi:sodium transport system ATP-binding protein